MSSGTGEPPLLEAVRLSVRPGDIVVIRPRDGSLTPNQAREVQQRLSEYQPEVTWLVLPLSADVTVLALEGTMIEGMAYERVRAFLDAWEAHDVGRSHTRSEGEPAGLAGAPGADGAYHDLLNDELRTVLDEHARMRAQLGWE